MITRVSRLTPVVAVLACLAVASIALQAWGATNAEPVRHAHRLPTRDHMEYKEDAPLPAAQPVPGAPPAQRVTFGRYTSIQVNVDSTGANIPHDAANEPSLAVDPTNPLHMVIGWRQFDNVNSNFRQAGYAYSMDEGRTWHFPGVFTPGVFRSDPVLGRDAEGNVGYMSLKEDFTMDWFRSADNGQTWSSPVPAYGGDKEWVAVDRTAGTGHDNVYSFYTDTPNFIRSTNHGSSFTPPTSIPSSPHWGTMAVAKNGDLYMIGVDDSYADLVFSKSTNAKDPSVPVPTFTTTSLASHFGGGIVSFGGPNPEGLLGQPWIGVDLSSGFTRGWIYACASVDPTGSDPLDVHFIRSTDGGTTWSNWVKINDDTGTSAYQWFGTMSVAPNGRIDVIWNDTRGQSSYYNSALYYSYSTNGGTTWSANQQLSPVWNSSVGWPQQDKIGDYYGMKSDLVGADLAWAATFNNEQDVYYLRIGDYDCNGNGVGDSLDIANGTSLDTNGNGIPDECEGLPTSISNFPAASGENEEMENAPNPFEGSTTIRFALASAGRVSLRVYDVSGHLVKTLMDADAPAGQSSVVWNGTDDRGHRVADGAYFYNLVTPGKSESHRMIMLH